VMGGCVNGRPVDVPLREQPSGTVTLRHWITSFATRNPVATANARPPPGRMSSPAVTGELDQY
jgi:hypothetical protein